MARSFQPKAAEESAEPRLQCVTAALGKDGLGSEVEEGPWGRGLAGSGEGEEGLEEAGGSAGLFVFTNTHQAHRSF